MIRREESEKERRVPEQPRGRLARTAALIAVGAAIAFAVVVRVRLADVPLERDEGEYAYAGQLILQKVPPYSLAYNMKFPGTYYAYAAILALFGETTRSIRLGLLVVNVATTLFLWRAGRRLIGELGGVAAAWAFAVLSLDRWVMGVFAHATHFVALPVVAALWVLLVGVERRRGFWFAGAGVLLGAAVLMKQQAALFVPFGAAVAFWAVWRQEPRDTRAGWARAGAVLAGALAPMAVVAAVLAVEGVLGAFWFWTFRYAKEYVTALPFSQAPAGLATGFAQVTRATLPFWIAAGLGLVALWGYRWSAQVRVFLTGFLAASFLAVCPGFYFREHYFIVMLPALALLVGIAAAALARLVSLATRPAFARAVAIASLGLLVWSYGAAERRYLFSMPPGELSRVHYGANPFIESPVVARYIREHTTDADRIAVLGSEPQIYFLSGRRSATGYIYTYPLMEAQSFARTMQEQMRREIEAAHPAYVVFVQVGTSWLAQPDSDQWIVHWGNQYMRECYDVVGVADIYSRDETRYVWGEDARGYRPVSDNVLYVFRRRSELPCAVPDEPLPR